MIYRRFWKYLELDKRVSEYECFEKWNCTTKRKSCLCPLLSGICRVEAKEDTKIVPQSVVFLNSGVFWMKTVTDFISWICSKARSQIIRLTYSCGKTVQQGHITRKLFRELQTTRGIQVTSKLCLVSLCRTQVVLSHDPRNEPGLVKTRIYFFWL